MVELTWIVRNILEPVFWSLLQWVWSLDPTPDVDSLPIQFYSYSSTGLLLWLFEKLPHTLLLAIFACGCCTILGVILLFCCFSASVAWKISRVVFSVVFVGLIKFVLWCWLIVARVCLHLMFIFTKASIRAVNRCQRIIEDRRRLRRSIATIQEQIQDRPNVPLSNSNSPAIDSSAFRPRRRRTRSPRRATRVPDQTDSQI